MCRAYRLIGLAVVCGLTLAARADDSSPPPATQAPPAQPPEVPPVRRLSLTPSLVTEPWLERALLPLEYEKTDGNAAVVMLRLPWEQPVVMNRVLPELAKYAELPPDDPRWLELKEPLDGRSVSELHRAATMRRAEWEYPLEGEPWATVMLPDVQGLRVFLQRGLAVNVHWHLTHGRLDKAHADIRAGLACSRHMAATPFVVTGLVAIANVNAFLNGVEQWATHPQADNLYWPLTALPVPFLSPTRVLEFEQQMLEGSVPGFSELDQTTTEDEWDKLAMRIAQAFSEQEGTREILELSTAEAVLDTAAAQWAERARQAPEGWAPPGRDVAAMGDVEVSLRWLVGRHRRLAASASALANLPPPVALPRLARLAEQIAEFSQQAQPFPTYLADPPRICLAHWRVDRRIAALRVIEALRQELAVRGSLPQALAEITALPVPIDPISGLPFEYQLEEGAARLAAPPVPGFDQPSLKLEYLLTVRP